MAERKETIFEHGYPQPPGGEALIRLWNERLTVKLLEAVWAAYDNLHARFLTNISWDLKYEDLERSITIELERELRRVVSGYAPYDVQHAPFEHESRSSPPAQPPAYDIAFVWRANPRIMWPLEAKVLKSDRASQLGDYTKTLRARYLTCNYAPFSPGGAMLAYLKAGNPTTVLGGIEKKLGCRLVPHAAFRQRDHRTSDHTRTVPPGKDYPVQFRCHHLVLQMRTPSGPSIP